MKKFTVTVCSGFVFSACIYFACISPASSQVDKGEAHSHQTDQKSKTIVSTPEQEPLQLEPIPEKSHGAEGQDYGSGQGECKIPGYSGFYGNCLFG